MSVQSLDFDRRNGANTARKSRYAPKQKRSEEAWAGRSIRMIESPAHRVLSLAALRALYRIEVEFSNHAGNDNGYLPVTFQQFEDWGVRRHSVASAIRELEALGFIEVTQHGYGGAAEKRAPNLYRLTYKPSHLALKEGPQRQHGRVAKNCDARRCRGYRVGGAQERQCSQRRAGKKQLCHPTKRPSVAPRKGGSIWRLPTTKRGVQAQQTKRGVLSRLSGGQRRSADALNASRWWRLADRE